MISLTACVINKVANYITYNLSQIYLAVFSNYDLRLV